MDFGIYIIDIYKMRLSKQDQMENKNLSEPNRMLNDLRQKSCAFCGLLLLLSLLISGCGLEDRYSEGLINPDSKAVGIYVGEDGGLLSLLEDGSAEYFQNNYYMPHTGKKWTYADNAIHIRYYDSLEIFTDAPSLDSNAFRFIKESGSGNWYDESYTKISNSAYHLTRDNGLELLTEKLPVLYPNNAAELLAKKTEITYEDYIFGGMVFQFPSIYEKRGDGCFVSTDGYSNLFLFTYNQGCIPEYAFSSYAGSIDKEFDQELVGNVDKPTRYYNQQKVVATLNGTETYYTGYINGAEVHSKTVLINNPHSEQLVRILFTYCDETPGYSDLYEKMLDTATLANNEQIASQSTDAVLLESKALQGKSENALTRQQSETERKIDWCVSSTGNHFIESYNSMYPDEAIKKSDIIYTGYISTIIRVSPDIVYNITESDNDPAYEVYGFSEFDKNNRGTIEEYARRLSSASGKNFSIQSDHDDSPIQVRYESAGMVVSYGELEKPKKKEGIQYTMHYFIYTNSDY